jgi:GxxExxY protein
MSKNSILNTNGGEVKIMETVLKICSEDLIDRVLTAATNVHAILGPGLLESVYESALAIELDEMGIKYQRQVEVPAIYKGHDLGVGFRADVIVEDSLLLELKSVEKIIDIHLAKIITYLKLLKFKRGFFLNFNCIKMKYGIKRISI